MSAAKRYLPHYTVEDYARWEGDWELWDGIAVSMSPGPFGRHQRVAARLIYSLQRSIEQEKCSAEVVYELDWIIGNDTVVRPDVLVLCEGMPDRHLETTPAMVAEVLSDSTRQRDQTFKRDLYDRQGVNTYLLLDPDAETLIAYQRDTAGVWAYEQVAGNIEIVICENCKIHLDRASLFAK
jgi:Uma2 family endonuclease